MPNAARRLVRHCLRRMIRSGLHGRLAHTPAALVARWLARTIGWPLLLDRDARILVADPAEYIQGEVIRRGTYEPEIASLILAVLRPGDLFIDIGANIGCHTLVAASCGATVCAFEPVPRLAAHLGRNVKLNRWGGRVAVEPLAVSRTTGSAVLHVASRSDDGSHSLLPGVDADAVQALPVGTITLDAYLSLAGYAIPTLIKIDVEGAEAFVLDGARGVLSASPCPLLIIETGDRLAERVNESAASVLGRLFDRGYRIFRISGGWEARLAGVDRSSVPGEVANYLAVHPHSYRSREALRFVGVGTGEVGTLQAIGPSYLQTCSTGPIGSI